MWLLNKLFAHRDQPTPRFAFQGTVNWMRGLAVLTDRSFSHDELRAFYRAVQRRQPNEAADAKAFEFLFMSMHNVSAIDSMEEIENPYPVIRSAIVAWYYATYYAAKAMLAASSGADPQTHASTGKTWQAEIVQPGLAKPPFDLSILDITPSNVDRVVTQLRNGNPYDLNAEPTDAPMAHGATYSYLKGTAEYEQWRLEEQVKTSSEYRRAGYTSFRSAAARALRDAKLRPAHVNFLTEAFRYRGKANYRDSIYLSYGRNERRRVDQLIADLGQVSGAFSLMAAHYVAKRVPGNDWNSFADDVTQYAQFTPPYDPSEI